MESVTEDLIRSDADVFEPPQKQFLLFGGCLDTLPSERAIWFAIAHPGWFGLSLEPWLLYFFALLRFTRRAILLPKDFGTLTLTLISRCAPFVDGLLFSAAIVTHHDTWLTSRLRPHLFLSPPCVTMILRDPPSCRGRVDLRPCLV